MSKKETDQITPEALRGGFKADNDKSRVDLIPSDVLLDVGELYLTGSKKYSENNWKIGMEYKRVYAALLRHVYKWWDGEEFDQTDGQHHLTSVIWCAIALRHYTLHPEKYAQFDSRNEESIRATEKNQK